MIQYSFEKDNGEVVCKWFPMGECPQSIVCDDGSTARRLYGCNISLFTAGGHLNGDAVSRMNAEMNRRQAIADTNMRQRYKSCKPSAKEE